MAKLSFKQMFPTGCGLFTAKEIVDLPHNGFDNAFAQRLRERFYTIDEVADAMECSEATARKRLMEADVNCMTLGNPNKPFQKMYYTLKDTEAVIQKYLNRKKKNDTA